MQIRFTINEVPVPKGRPKFTKFGHAYTPSKTREYEKIVSMSSGYKGEPTEDPLKVDVKFFMPIPKSMSKKDYNDAVTGTKQHTKRPDVDNLVKAILDGLNGIVWKDDSQIVSLSVDKRYGVRPMTEVSVESKVVKKGGDWF